MTEPKLCASQMEAIRAIDALLAMLSLSIGEPLGTMCQATFSPLQTRREKDEPPSVKIRLKGRVWCGRNGRLTAIEGLLELKEMGDLWWELQCANVVIGNVHYAVNALQIFDDGRRFTGKIEQQPLSQFPF